MTPRSTARIGPRPSVGRQLRRALLGRSDRDAERALGRLRIEEPGARAHAAAILEAFFAGYNHALEEEHPGALDCRLETVERSHRGFAAEGAAMALAVVDALTLAGARRWRAFADGPGAAHVYMAHVGYGWAVARTPLRRPAGERTLAPLDPLLRWLAVDGYGFHAGFFDPARHVAGRALPGGLAGYARRAFDQGLGRSLWFVEGFDAQRVADRIASFETVRRADLWSGAGLACAYAGAPHEGAAEALLQASGEAAAEYAQGVAFGAEARARAGNPVPHTERACRAVWGRSVKDTAALVRTAAPDSGGPGDMGDTGDPGDSADPGAYENWRRRVMALYTAGGRCS